MSLNALETEILWELKDITKNPKLKKKNIQEWSTSKIKAQEGEKLIFLPNCGVWVAYKI